MLKYIVIWLCIGYVVTLIYFIYYYNFDVNMALDDAEVYMRKHPGNDTDEIINEMRSDNTYAQIVLDIVIIVAIVIWPILMRDFVRTFKRKFH